MLFIGPGIQQSGIINDLVRHVDIFPTLANLMKFPINSKSSDGRSLLNMINGESEIEIPSVANLWRTANWHEREAYDLLGIKFTDHPELKRILLPEDWEGHPLKKDYETPDFYNGMPVPKDKSYWE